MNGPYGMRLPPLQGEVPEGQRGFPHTTSFVILSVSEGSPGAYASHTGFFVADAPQNDRRGVTLRFAPIGLRPLPPAREGAKASKRKKHHRLKLNQWCFLVLRDQCLWSVPLSPTPKWSSFMPSTSSQISLSAHTEQSVGRPSKMWVRVPVTSADFLASALRAL